jgi:E3 ubiquitin-protein ligase HUWE1
MRRFQLLTRVRVARRFASLEGRRHLARVRLLAFYVLFQSNPAPEALAEYYGAEPEFVQELVGLLLAGGAVPEDLRTHALRVLAVQLLDRGRHTAVIAAISAGGQSGLLSMLMHRAIASLSRAGGAPADADEQQGGGGERFSTAFVEALLSLVGALSASSSGCTALSEAGVIPALLPLLKDRAPAHVMLVGTGVRILEAFMDFAPSAASAFRDAGGLSDMIERLRAEVQPTLPPTPAPAAASSSAQAKDGAQDMQTDEAAQPQREVAALAGAGGGAGGAAAAAGEAERKPVSYASRVLLKSLLRAIALTSYAPHSRQQAPAAGQTRVRCCCRCAAAAIPLASPPS